MSDALTPILDAQEAALVAAVERGVPFWPDAAAFAHGAPSIRAEVLRAVLLALPVRTRADAAPRPVALTAAGLRIRPPATPQQDWQHVPRLAITGRLDIGGVTAPGGGPAAHLELEYCAFAEPIDMAAATLGSVSLHGSRFTALRMDDAELCGSLHLSRCGPLPGAFPAQRESWPFAGSVVPAVAAGPEGEFAFLDFAGPIDKIDWLLPDRRLEPCIASLAGMRIDGSCTINESDFVRPAAMAAPFPDMHEPPAAALILSGCCISGNLNVDRSVVVGGVVMIDAQITDCAWFSGSRLLAGQGGRFDEDALLMQHCRFDGGLHIYPDPGTRRPGFTESLFLGMVSARGAVARSVFVHGARFDALDQGAAIAFHGLHVDGDINLGMSGSGLRLIGALSLPRSRVKGGVQMSGVVLDRTAGWPLDLAFSTIDGPLQIDGIGWWTPGRMSRTARDLRWREWAEHAFAVPCYPRHVLCVAGPTDGGEPVPAWIVDRDDPGGGVPLDGTSAPIHDLNERDGVLRLDSDEDFRSYLILFCRFVHGGDGPFHIVDRIDAAAWETAPAAPPAALSSAGALDASGNCAFAPRVREDPLAIEADSRTIDALVCYGAAVFFATFLVHRDGRIDMIEDEPIGIVTSAARKALSGFETDAPVRPVSVGEELPAATLDALRASPVAALPVVTQPGVDQHGARIDLSNLRCSYLEDENGLRWGLAEHPGVLLELPGFHCDRCETAGAIHIHDARAAATATSLAPDAPVPGSTVADAFGRAAPSGAPVPIDNAQSGSASARARWLERQFATRESDTGERTPLLHEGRFVPHAWDMFANAYNRAGERDAARTLLLDRRNRESELRAQRLRNLLRRPGAFGLSRRGIAAIAAATSAVVLAFAAQRSGWGGIESAVPALVLAGAIGILFLPLLSRLVDAAFRIGFGNGLSPGRALATFAALLVIGTLGTHQARTGSLLGSRVDWAALENGDRLDPRIALVLATGYSADRPDAAMRSRAPREGEAVFAAPAPCNLGVSSALYAIDTFIPVLDLDQESRCMIREEPGTGERYFGWRVAKAIYEILGWVVSSMLILTITGILRRDVER